MTKRQAARRAAILSAARQLIAEFGYDGFTLKDLAQRSGVAIQTLYDIYGSKEEVLTKAIAERLDLVYEDILRYKDAYHGIQWLFYVLDRCTDRNLEFPQLVQAVAPMLMANSTAFSTEEKYSEVHGEALSQVAAAGELTEDANPDLLLRLILLQRCAAVLHWANGQVPSSDLKAVTRLWVGAILLPFTVGATHEWLDKATREAAALCSAIPPVRSR